MIAFSLFFFFFNDTATTEIYTLSLHDALPILRTLEAAASRFAIKLEFHHFDWAHCDYYRSEEHTSELQSRLHLVCRLLLEKKKKRHTTNCYSTHSVNSLSIYLYQLVVVLDNDA